ncbi:hypothetical protein [Stutzerimonas tarimensis]|uniref:Uncharacterized protein n=1 Tax=Stutzerimonas tarimensis TaxID=1507735 RepID=A0ABV7T0X9_9GAMM
MIRIRGRIGNWPVDLEVDLDASDWAQLGKDLSAVEAGPTEADATAAPRSSPGNDPLWQAAQDLLREAGELSGPALLEQFEPLTGNMAAAKRLLVRLRHCPQVRIQQDGETPLYRWTG